LSWADFWKEKEMSNMDGPDAPFPGMATAFETHTGQSWTDIDWRAETATWASAWKHALRQQQFQKLGARLADLLDEDQWAECEALLLSAGVTPNAGGEATGAGLCARSPRP
jgi:hypothetical protein